MTTSPSTAGAAPRSKNIQNLGDHFKGARTIKLEQNYRSTQTILSAANRVIANNTGRLGKELWTEGREGDPISLYAGFNEQDEARFIVSRIEEWIEQGNRRADSAILYRSNAQSRVLEEALIRNGVPYRIYGGHRFYDRLEIKNALAYLRLVANRDDDTAMERVVNVPTRGIGTRTIEAVRAQARAEKYLYVARRQRAGRIQKDSRSRSHSTTGLSRLSKPTRQ